MTKYVEECCEWVPPQTQTEFTVLGGSPQSEIDLPSEDCSRYQQSLPLRLIIAQTFLTMTSYDRINRDPFLSYIGGLL
jgi:hypothetical protein